MLLLSIREDRLVVLLGNGRDGSDLAVDENDIIPSSSTPRTAAAATTTTTTRHGRRSRSNSNNPL